MSDNPYEVALKAALSDMEQLKIQERQLAIQKAKIQETINALSPLVFADTVDVNSLSLPNAMRLVIRGAGRPLSATDFKTKLQDIGFDISKYENPLANIHTAMTRMCESDEMQWVQMEGKKKAIPGPELKSIPQDTQNSATTEVWKALLEGLKEEKK